MISTKGLPPKDVEWIFAKLNHKEEIVKVKIVGGRYLWKIGQEHLAIKNFRTKWYRILPGNCIYIHEKDLIIL